jgi:hypothetical protein
MGVRVNRPNPSAEIPIARWLALIVGSGLLLVGLSMRFAPAVWDGQRWMASDTFSKVGLVLFYRPKTILFTGPFISVAIAIALLRGWWQRGGGR